jgi:hypothetical protein
LGSPPSRRAAGGAAGGVFIRAPVIRSEEEETEEQDVIGKMRRRHGDMYRLCIEVHSAVIIAHLAESRFGFSASTFLPMALQTPKHLGFGVFMPFRVRRDTPFGLKMPASCDMRHGEMTFSTTKLFGLGYPANGFFIFL